VSKAKGIDACWFSEHALSCLTILLDVALRSAYPTVSAETSVKFLHACLPPTHPEHRLVKVDLPSIWSVKKFIDVFSFTDIPTCSIFSIIKKS
jgi:hypothetical protein